MKRLVLIVALSGLLVPLAGCASAPASVTTPQGQFAYKADQFVSAVGIFQDAAIQANAQTPPLISTADTRLIVTFCVASAKSAQAATTGWQATVLSSIASLKAALSPAAQTKYGTYLTLISTLVQGIT